GPTAGLGTPPPAAPAPTARRAPTQPGSTQPGSGRFRAAPPSAPPPIAPRIGASDSGPSAAPSRPGPSVLAAPGDLRSSLRRAPPSLGRPTRPLSVPSSPVSGSPGGHAHGSGPSLDPPTQPLTIAAGPTGRADRTAPANDGGWGARPVIDSP